MKQGDAVLIWGATGGIGGYAVQYVLNGGGTPVGVVSSPEQGRAAARAGLRGRHRPQGRGLQVLDGRAHPGRGRVAPLRQGHPRRSSATTPTSCSSTPAARRWARRCSSCKRGGTIVTCAATRGYMIEYDNRHLWMKLKRIIASPLRQLPRGVGRPTGSSPRARSSRCCRRCTRSTDVGEAALPGAPATSTRARSACCASRPRRASASTTPSSARRSARTRSRCSGGTA